MNRFHPDQHLWSGVVPVAVPVRDDASLLRVAMIEPRTNTMLGQVSLPAERVRDDAGRLDMTAVADTVRLLADKDPARASAQERSQAAACTRLLQDLSLTIPPF